MFNNNKRLRLFSPSGRPEWIRLRTGYGNNRTSRNPSVVPADLWTYSLGCTRWRHTAGRTQDGYTKNIQPQELEHLQCEKSKSAGCHTGQLETIWSVTPADRPFISLSFILHIRSGAADKQTIVIKGINMQYRDWDVCVCPFREWSCAASVRFTINKHRLFGCLILLVV